MIVAIMTTALSGTVWGQSTATLQITSSVTSQGNLTDDGSNSWAFTTDGELTASNSYIQAGTNKKEVSYIRLTTSAFSSKKITKVQVWGTSKANTSVSAKVIIGTTTIGTSSVYTSQTASSGGTEFSVNNINEVTGDLTIEISRASSATGAIYFNKAIVTYVDGSSSAVATTTTIDDSGITNTDVYTGTAAGSLSASVTAGGSAVAGATVTWSGNNDDVATINESTGVVTLVGAGSVKFTASYAGVSNEYLASSAEYTMTVTNSAPASDFIFNTDEGLTELGITKPGSSTGTDLATNHDYTIGIVTMNVTHGSTNTRVWAGSNGATDLRVYKEGGSLTFTVPAGYAITKVTFAGTIGLDNQTDGVWTASGDPVNTVTFTNGSTGSKINTITVEYKADNTPIITASTNEIAYDATSGSITYSVANPVEGGVVTAASSESWLTVGTPSDGTIALTCAANSETTARTAIVTLTYTYNTNETATTNVTVTQAGAPVIYTTIPDLFAKATEVGNTETNVNVTFGNWVVSGVHSNNVFLTDNQGNGLIIYTSNHGFAVNDKLSGTVSETPLKLFNGFAEFTNLTASTSGLTVTNDGEITVITNKTIADLGGVNTGAVITLSNLTYDGTNLSDGTNTIKPYNSLYSEMSLTSGKTYNITGIYEQFNSTKEILPRSAADIVEVQAQHSEYTLTVGTLTNVEMFVFDAANQSSALIDGEGSAQVYDGTQVLISVSAEAGYERESLIVDGNDVTSAIVSDEYTFTMPAHAVTVTATAVAVTPVTNKTLTNANIVAAGDAANSYSNWYITDENGKTWNAYAIKNQHSNATSGYHYLQIKKYASNTAYYLQVPEYGTKITSITMTVSGSSQPMTGGSNGATLFFSASNSTAAAGEGVASGTGASEVTIDCSSLNLNTGYITASAAVRIWDVTVVYEYAPSTITLNASGYATFASTSAVDFGNTTGCTAWAVTGVSGSEITFSQITGAVPAGTGVLLKGETSATVTLSYTTSGTAVAGNKLVGITAETPILTNQYYGLSGTQFVKVNAGTVPAGKALLPASEVAGVKAFTFVFEDDATGIEETLSNSPLKGENIYNLAGQMVNGKSVNGKLPKGIYIVNGKKIMVK